VRHFDFLTERERADLFTVEPEPFHRDSPARTLAISLGATLYSPGTRARLDLDARRAAAGGATSHVWCLEDSIAHEDVPRAQANVVDHLCRLVDLDDRPLLFVRVRSAEQILEIAASAGAATGQLTGFVLPKMAPDERGKEMLDAVAAASETAGSQIFALPVLEHEELAWTETRSAHLQGLRAMFDAHRELILSLRVGGTDLCGLFGLRRDSETTIWDVAVVRDALAEVLNTFTRRGDYVVSGPVWEHFSGTDRLFKPQLRMTPFEEGGLLALRKKLLRDDVDALLREVLLDRANGFHGKTVIHPTHLAIVNAMQAVSQEEHDDALAILANPGRGGLAPSAAGNKMNELGPHSSWAEQVVLRASAFGVLAKPDAVLELLQRGRDVADLAYSPTFAL
jgi:citrate lyase beta subunit